jgi:hypothetical protein
MRPNLGIVASFGYTISHDLRSLVETYNSCHVISLVRVSPGAERVYNVYLISQLPIPDPDRWKLTQEQQEGAD